MTIETEYDRHDEVVYLKDNNFRKGTILKIIVDIDIEGIKIGYIIGGPDKIKCDYTLSEFVAKTKSELIEKLSKIEVK